ncbi:hypothetical protein BJ741DRAFT_651206 [Chytriomyces cf. hyalinus JEL632]|nr:hypothetical protein BJ741DRAFT_651206 [Chytriomyces cf. hyalinus JEL632]
MHPSAPTPVQPYKVEQVYFTTRSLSISLAHPQQQQQQQQHIWTGHLNLPSPLQTPAQSFCGASARECMKISFLVEDYCQVDNGTATTNDTLAAAAAGVPVFGLFDSGPASLPSPTHQDTQHQYKQPSPPCSTLPKKTRATRPTTSSQEKQTFICETCSKVFYRKHHLASHLDAHRTGKPFRCYVNSNCPAAFRRIQDLRRHMQKVRHDY